jgi:Mg2+ and Co2+ transporter CorA
MCLNARILTPQEFCTGRDLNVGNYRLLFIALFFLSLITGCSSVDDQAENDALPDALTLIKNEKNAEYFEQRIAEAHTAKDYDTVRMYQSIAQSVNVQLDNEKIDQLIKENDTVFNSTVRNTTHFIEGAIYGEGETMAHLAGSITADFTFLGDARDLLTESNKYLNDEEVDYFVLSLSIIGIGETVATVSSAGLAAPKKIGISVLKASKKTGNLSPSLAKKITKQIDEAIDSDAFFKAVKEIDAQDVSILEKAKLLEKQLSKQFAAADVAKLKKLGELASKISTIKDNVGSLADAMKVVKHADTPEEVGKLAKLSDKFKTNTVGILEILGKRAIDTLGFFMSVLYYLVATIFWLIKVFIWIFCLVLLIKPIWRQYWVGAVAASVSLFFISYYFLSFNMIYAGFH